MDKQLKFENKLCDLCLKLHCIKASAISKKFISDINYYFDEIIPYIKDEASYNLLIKSLKNKNII